MKIQHVPSTGNQLFDDLAADILVSVINAAPDSTPAPDLWDLALRKGLEEHPWWSSDEKEGFCDSLEVAIDTYLVDRY